MKGLLSVSFGTSYEQTRVKTIDVVDQLLLEAFPERKFYSAWTSGKIVARVREERGEHHDTLDEAFARLTEAGIDDLLVTTMCLMRGHEMAKIERAARAWEREGEGRTVRISAPLLTSEADRQAIAQAICNEFAVVPEEDALLLMGHGSPNASGMRDGKPYDANAVYAQLQDSLHALGREKFFVGTVEGTPTFDDALALVEQCGSGRVWLAPFMIVAGDHATNDLAGEDEESWKSIIESHGLRTEVVLKGLGEYADVQHLVVEHAHAAEDGE